MNYTRISLFLVALLLSGCQLLDKLDASQEAQSDFTIQNTPTAQHIDFQDPSARKRAIVTADCKFNESVNYKYYETPEEATADYFNDTKDLISNPGSGKALKPFWDIRYINRVQRYIYHETNLEIANHARLTGLDARSGKDNIEIGVDKSLVYADASVAQAKCVEGNVLAAGTSINLLDASDESITYAGPQSTFMYRIDSTIASPWESNATGNLAIQAYFDRPVYNKYTNNKGGGVNFGLYLYNKKNGAQLNFIIGLYAAGGGWTTEQSDFKFDPTTNIVHVATVASDSSKWSTKSPQSQSIIQLKGDSTTTSQSRGKWNEFFRVNISYQNLLSVLQKLQTDKPAEVLGVDFGLSPQDWEVKSVFIQYELEENGGKALLSGSFKGFEAYASPKPF